MRSVWLAAVLGCVGCTGLNPAFFAGSGDDSDGATGTGPGASTSVGATTQPGTSTESPPTTGGSETSASTGAVSVGETTTTGETTGSTGAVSVGETTTTTTSDASTGDASSTGVEPAICGNLLVEPGEVCDDGPNPILVPGACLPTCDGFIETKRILAGGALIGDFALNGGLIVVADAGCGSLALENGFDGTFKAMISDGATRYAAIAPLDPGINKAWVLKPYTAYLNESGLLVWVTNSFPLLGVISKDQLGQLKNPITPSSMMVWTGMATDWTTTMSTCGQWKELNGLGTAGDANLKTGYLDKYGAVSCEKTYGLICVEQ